MNFWIKHGWFEESDGSFSFCLPGRLNTRRNRRLCQKYFWSNYETIFEARSHQHRAALRNAGEIWQVQNFLLLRKNNPWMSKQAALKFFAAWWGVRLRKISREVHRQTRVALARKEAA